jgi:hypothetical protein
MFLQVGIEVEAWSRLPYLACGYSKTHYELDSALFVLRLRRDTPEEAAAAAAAADAAV